MTVNIFDTIDLQESYEEMQAMLLTRSIQQGQSLLTDSNNLAAELEKMTQDDVSIFIIRYNYFSFSLPR